MKNICPSVGVIGGKLILGHKKVQRFLFHFQKWRFCLNNGGESEKFLLGTPNKVRQIFDFLNKVRLDEHYG